MTLSDHSLRQIDEESINSLPEDAVRTLAIKLLNDLKEARERLNRNSQNSPVPPGSEAPWDKGSKGRIRKMRTFAWWFEAMEAGMLE